MPLLVVLGVGTVLSAVYLPWLTVLFALLLGFVIWFFRDPERLSPAPQSALVSPADGRIVEIARVDAMEHVGGAATKIAVFMSVFNVHVNRSPAKANVEWVRHEPGRYMNAIRSNAGLENEHTLIALRDVSGRPMLVNMVAGLIARRIVCATEAGRLLHRGERLGMIKFGSRVEVFLPDGEGFHVAVRLGQSVRAGRSILGEWQ